MKKFTLLTFIACFSILSGTGLLGQVAQAKKQMSLGIQNGFSISLPDTEDKFIEKQWKKFTKDYGKTKENKKADEIFIEGAVIKTINGENAMDIYTAIENNSIAVFFDNKNGFINSTDNPKEAKSAEEFIQEFAYEVQREKTRIELDNEKDQLKKYEKNLEKLKRDLDGYNKDIEVAKDKIKKAEMNIVQNGKDQEKAQIDINTQMKTVEMVQKKLSEIGKSK